MDAFEAMAKVLIGIGVVSLLLGGLLWLVSHLPFLGELPGDLQIEGRGFTCLIPLASSILLSIVLTVLLNVFVRLVLPLLRR